MKLERHHLVVAAVLTIFVGMKSGGWFSSEWEASNNGLVVPESGQEPGSTPIEPESRNGSVTPCTLVPMFPTHRERLQVSSSE